jgi:plastocyanin
MTMFRLSAAAALSLALGASAAAQPGGQTIQVWSYGFSPKPIHLAAGKPVTLTFVNQSGSDHDFVAKTFFGRSTITKGEAPEGEIDLPKHSTRSITLVPYVGTYKAHCSHFLHAPMGMTDEIIVQ